MKHRPLAHRMRPQTLEDIVGQEHLIGKNRPIRRMIEMNQISSFVLFGPPGTGKSTIAEVLAKKAKLPFIKLNAVSISKKDIETAIKESEKSESSIVLYIDEIHRLTRPQSELLLPSTESGEIILIGSTTESPFHSVPPAILSRSTVFETKNLSSEDIVTVLKRTLNDNEIGLGKFDIKADDEALEFIAKISGGDLRTSLNILENVFIAYSENGKLEMTIELIENATRKKYFNANGKNSSYNLLSALQKSIRGSDVNAALYYLALLLEMGELESVCRRIMIIADEDISLAYLDASTHALTAATIAKQVGLKESIIPLSKIVIELCLAPKSNSAYAAYKRVLEDIQSGKVYEVPNHLKDNHYKGAQKLGVGGYLYAHDYKDPVAGHWVQQEYLPRELKGRQYYIPGEVGHEKNLRKMYQYLQNKNNKPG